MRYLFLVIFALAALSITGCMSYNRASRAAAAGFDYLDDLSLANLDYS
jgi:hypothetical protein